MTTGSKATEGGKSARNQNEKTPGVAPPRTNPSTPDAEKAPSREAARPNSTSLGHPNDGSLEGAVPMPMKGEGFRFNPRKDPKGRFGTIEMVESLQRAAKHVAQTLPGSEVFFNDLSLEEGGPIARHESHRVGRDVDVLFYILDKEGKPREPVGAPLNPKGEGTDYQDLRDPSDDVPVRIDIPRSWAFVEALLLDAQTHPSGAKVQRIFLVEHVRTMLLEHAEKIKAPKAAIQAFAERTCQPGAPHDDHFHFRFFCTEEDIRKGCLDGPPMYPWRKTELRAAGLAAKVSRARPNRPRSRTVSAKAAEKRAGPMHPSVKRFLKKRKSWSKIPHPGRPYCK